MDICGIITHPFVTSYGHREGIKMRDVVEQNKFQLLA
jgi:hypothetical protein